jgi:hypothetical protein
MTKLIVTGLRTCDRKETVFAEIQKYLTEIGPVDEIISGGSTGVDKYAREFAESHQIKYKEFAPNWQDDLNAAGMIRDSRMAEYASHLLVLSNGVSKESKNLVEQAKLNNLAIKTVGAFTGVAEAEVKIHSGFPVVN